MFSRSVGKSESQNVYMYIIIRGRKLQKEKQSIHGLVFMLVVFMLFVRKKCHKSQPDYYSYYCISQKVEFGFQGRWLAGGHLTVLSDSRSLLLLLRSFWEVGMAGGGGGGCSRLHDFMTSSPPGLRDFLNTIRTVLTDLLTIQVS